MRHGEDRPPERSQPRSTPGKRRKHARSTAGAAETGTARRPAPARPTPRPQKGQAPRDDDWDEHEGGEPEPEPPPRRRGMKPGKSTGMTLAMAQRLGSKLNPPERRDDKARYFAVENWIRDWVQERAGRGPRQSAMVQIASWVIDQVRPYAPKGGYPKASPKFQRKRDSVTWVVFRCQECARDVTLKERDVQRTLGALVALGLVERYSERTKPEAEGRAWYGRDTQVVRVRYELYRAPPKEGDEEE